GLGYNAVEAIVEARAAGGPFRDLLDFCTRVETARVNRRALEALVQAGTMDALGPNRASLMQQLPEVLRATEQMAREKEAGQVSLFGDAGLGGAEALPQVVLTEVPDWPLAQKLAGERDTLGHYLSGHPLDPFRDLLAPLVSGTLAQDALDAAFSQRRGREAQVPLAGVVGAVR